MVTDRMLPALGSLRTRALELEVQSSHVTLEVRQRRPKKRSPRSHNHSEFESELKSGSTTLGFSILI